MIKLNFTFAACCYNVIMFLVNPIFFYFCCFSCVIYPMSSLHCEDFICCFTVCQDF